MFSTTWAFHLSKEGAGLDHITHVNRSLLTARKIHPDILLVVDCHRDGRKPSLGQELFTRRPDDLSPGVS